MRGKGDRSLSTRYSSRFPAASTRTNTSLIRRRLRAPELKIREHIVGRQSLTPVDVLWLEGIADPDTVARVEKGTSCLAATMDRASLGGMASG